MEQEKPPHRHEHGGRSTRGLINPGRVLHKIGLKVGETLLDLGCGDGYISIEAATRFIGSNGHVHAFDADPRGIVQLQARIEAAGARNIDAAVVDATKRLPLPDSSVDTCLIANVMHGFVVNKEVEPVFKELLRVLKRGGKIAIIEFKKKKYLPGPRFDERIAPGELDEILGKHGGRAVASFTAGPLHYARVYAVS